MSTATSTKTQRFAVTYEGKRHHAVAETPNGALLTVRSRLIAEAARDEKEPAAGLATLETFSQAASCIESPRY